MTRFSKLAIYVLLILLLSSISIYAENDVPQRIRVGLEYEETAVTNVTLKAKHGFTIGYYDNNNYINLLDLTGYSGLIVRKDSYYNESLTPLDSKSGASIGPYHVQLGDSFNDLADALSTLVAVREEYPNCYVAIDKGYKIWTGAFVDESSAKSFISKFDKIHNRKLKFVNSNGRRAIVNDYEGKILFAFNTDGLQLNFKSLDEIEGSNLVDVNGKRYRGDIIFNRHEGGNLIVINNILVDNYLYGVLPKEMSGSWALEALKAQAVAARNYGIVNIGKHNDLGFDICDTIDCQVYGGYDIEKPRSNEAVDATTGITITYDGELITPFYHSNSGGRTEDSENIWSIDLPYIRGVEDEFSLGAPNGNWSIAFTPEQVESYLNALNIDIGRVLDIYPLSYSQNGRVTNMMFVGTKGKIEIPKEKTRAMFGYTTLKSMQFTMNTDESYYILNDLNGDKHRESLKDKYVINDDGNVQTVNRGDIYLYDGEKTVKPSKSSDKFVFTGKGYGHGLGMSQWGAKKMAEEGYKFDEILLFYYTGTKVE